jgi:hypothetical protein
MFRAFVAPDRFSIPLELRYSHWLHETGWPPNVLDEVSVDVLENFMTYRRIRRNLDG